MSCNFLAPNSKNTNTNTYKITYQTELFLIISSSKSKPYTQFPLNILSLPHPLFSSLIGPIPCLCPLLFIYATIPGGASQIHTSLSNSLGLNLSLSLSLSLSSIFMRWSFLSLLPLKPSLILRLVLIYGERINWSCGVPNGLQSY